MSTNKGFTLVEVVIVIAVIAILATIAAVGLNGYLQDGRDRERVANITVLSEALEKYYDQNGEYPSCEAITTPADEVAANVLKGIDKAALLVPGANGEETNAIRCGETLTTNTSTEFIEYVGDGSADCSGDKACLSYTLRYLSEGDNDYWSIARLIELIDNGQAEVDINNLEFAMDTERIRSVAKDDDEIYQTMAIGGVELKFLSIMGVSNFGNLRLILPEVKLRIQDQDGGISHVQVETLKKPYIQQSEQDFDQPVAEWS